MIHPIEWLRDDCPAWAALFLLIMGLIFVALTGVWIMLATYGLHLLTGGCYGWSGIEGCS